MAPEAAWQAAKARTRTSSRAASQGKEHLPRRSRWRAHVGESQDEALDRDLCPLDW
jgi:hypothetical protein